MNKNRHKEDLLEGLRSGKELSGSDCIRLVISLSIPAILARLSSIMMQYIDTSMVGALGPSASASVGLVTSTTWLFEGTGVAACTGFSVQIAHAIGGGDHEKARRLLKEGYAACLLLGVVFMLLTTSLSGRLPVWLGGEPEVCGDAAAYFRMYSLFLPFSILNTLATFSLQCSGNMKLPSAAHVVMCLLDVVLNALLIFEGRTITLLGIHFYLPGAGLGVLGASLGTGLSKMIIMLFLTAMAWLGPGPLRMKPGEKLPVKWEEIRKAIRIAVPSAVMELFTCSAYIASTRIVATISSAAVAAHSFSITAESICYMPGYGIAVAATTLIGQSIGAGRKELSRRLGYTLTALGIGLMTLSGVLLYILAPQMIGILSPDPTIRQLGTQVLRIEAFAEPMYAASIVITGVMQGMGDTLSPCILNLLTMWGVRIPISVYMARHYGLNGVWAAMCFELWVRGILYLIRLVWQNRKTESGRL